jgi:hypothetical protein
LCLLRYTCCSATLVPIKGDVEGIERAGGRTEVLVTEGLTTVSYALHDALVTFDTALKERVRPQPTDLALKEMCCRTHKPHPDPALWLNYRTFS